MAAKIPLLIKNDPQKLWSLIAPGRGAEDELRLYKYPIMKYVDLNEFVEALIEMDPANVGRFTILHALKDRYENIHSYPELKEDLPWPLGLETKMKDKLPNLKQPTKYQFTSLLVNLNSIIKAMQNYTK
jgi:hypothetical protein